MNNLAPPRGHAWVATFAVWATVAITLAGIVATQTWRSTNPKVLGYYLLLAATVCVLAAAGWALRRGRFLPLYAATWLLAWAYYAGLGPMAATLLLVLAALGAGSVLVPAGLPARVPLACVAGLAMIAGTTGWLLPLHVHRPGVYFFLLSLVVACRGQALTGMFRQLRAELGALAAPDRGTGLAAFAGITVIGIASTCTWLPTLQSDDISYHLALPWQLQALGYYRMDAASSIWAMAPWAGDVLHAIPQVLSGEESRGALNGVWFLLGLSLMWRMAGLLDLPPAGRWLALALYASMPMSASLLGGMQTETATTAVLLALGAMLLDRRPRDGRWLFLLATLSALLISLKLSNVLMLAAFGAGMAAIDHRLPWRYLPLAAVWGAVLAGSSYAYAYLVTGNPVLPFLNGIFHSPFFIQENWKDGLWMSGIDLRTPWDITFRTTRYLNARDGVAGMAVLLLLAGLGLALFRRRARVLALVAIAAFVLLFCQIQYLRYVHPVMVLSIPAALSGLALAGRASTWQAAGWLAVACSVPLLTTGYWQLHSGVLAVSVLKGREAAFEQFAPQRHVAAYLRQSLPGTQVLFHAVVSHGNAELAGRGFTDAWYDWELSEAAGRAEDDPSGQAWRTLLVGRGFEAVVAPRSGTSDGFLAALRALDARMVFEAGGYRVWTLATQRMIDSHTYVDPKYTKITFRPRTPVRVIQYQAVMRCDKPDVPIVMSLSRRDPGAEDDTFIRSEWAICDAGGHARYAGSYTFDRPSTQFAISAQPKEDMHFTLESINVSPRGDLARERDAALALREQLGLRRGTRP